MQFCLRQEAIDLSSTLAQEYCTKFNKMSVERISSAFVLDNHTPEDVAKGLIEDGGQKEPFYVFDMDEAFRRIEHFRKMMPRVQMFYAMKANDCDKMIKLVAALGLGFDCASPGEISKILSLNVSPRSIIFAVPTKTPDWMKYARESGVQHTTFDTSYQLKKIKQYWPNANLLIRIKVEGDSIYKLGDKFGCDFETEAIDLLEEAAALGLRVVGVAFHVGSPCLSSNSYQIGLKLARQLFDHEAKSGRQMKIVDIGGGFLSEHTDQIDPVAKVVSRTLDEVFPDQDVQVIAEPGRYICESSFKMYCSINNVRRVTRGGETVNMIYLNDGLFGALRYIEPWYSVKKFERSSDIKNEKLEKTILWGPSCDSTDRVMENTDILLPRCTSFDWLVFTAQGAYTFGFASFFSCLEKTQIRSVISRNLWNKIKDSKVFKANDFVIHPNILTPLPSTLPPILKNKDPLKSNNTLIL